jgi:hypothetical protein
MKREEKIQWGIIEMIAKSHHEFLANHLQQKRAVPATKY